MKKCFFKREIKEIDKISKTLDKEEKKQAKEFANSTRYLREGGKKWA